MAALFARQIAGEPPALAEWRGARASAYAAAAASAAAASAYASAYAAYSDAAAVSASAAASAAAVDARDRALAEYAEWVVEILIDMRAPGCQWLDLVPLEATTCSSHSSIKPSPLSMPRLRRCRRRRRDW